tara:strand:+ start:42 stop:476 length:435 start_codon:yes stop_codon:yes gene_type:complete
LYEVGQILYLLINKNKKIAPVQVIEQIVKKSISCEEVSYTVQLPNTEKSKVLLSNIDCEVFTCALSIRSSMLSNATNAIDKLVSDSKNIAISVFPQSKKANSDYQKKKVEKVINTAIEENVESVVTVDLGNGIKGKIDIASLEM